jgi:hypothetical protein
MMHSEEPEREKVKPTSGIPLVLMISVYVPSGQSFFVALSATRKPRWENWV